MIEEPTSIYRLPLTTWRILGEFTPRWNCCPNNPPTPLWVGDADPVVKSPLRVGDCLVAEVVVAPVDLVDRPTLGEHARQRLKAYRLGFTGALAALETQRVGLPKPLTSGDPGHPGGDTSWSRLCCATTHW